MPPSTRRTPTTTATSATPSVAASSSTVPERNATLSVPIVVAAVAVARLGDPLRLGLAAVESPERRQPAHRVEEVGREQCERLPPLAGTPLCVAPDQPHEHGDERQREQHHACGDKVDRRDEDEHGDRHGHSEDDLREIARERRLERVDAADRSGGDLGALGAVERGRLTTQPSLDELEPELREHVHRRAPAHDLEAVGCGRPSPHDRDEQPERQCHVCERGAAEAAGCDTGEQDCLGENEERREHAEGNVHREQSPHAPRAPHETLVEDPQDQLEGDPLDGRASASVGGCTSSPVTRARKT